jgi:tryptophanyl-tRNA synthetase
MAIDQDAYFRLLRENAHRMKNPSPKPALIHSRFLTALQGVGGKMSASQPTSAVFMDDSPALVKKKINKYAFSGGRETLEEHQLHGGNPDVDVAFQYITYFEDDDEKVKKLESEYRAGTLTTGEMKKECIELLQAYVKGYQTRREAVTEEVLQGYMKPRKLEWSRSDKIHVPIQPTKPTKASKKGKSKG